MQDTRLNRLLVIAGGRLETILANPWRRLALIVITLLFGNFVGTVAFTTTIGQRANLDVLGAAVALFFTETISWLIYRNRQRSPLNLLYRPPLRLELLNAFKLGLAYGLYLEAFKLGS